MATKEDARQAREAKLDELHQRLTGAVEQLVSGADWAAARRLDARFWSRSLASVMLVSAQHISHVKAANVEAPFSSSVAGYRQWQQLGRQVEKAQGGYQILAPFNGRFASENPSDPVSWY